MRSSDMMKQRHISAKGENKSLPEKDYNTTFHLGSIHTKHSSSDELQLLCDLTHEYILLH